jgi:hypothetical protein
LALAGREREALDGTPILDVKAVLDAGVERGSWIAGGGGAKMPRTT